VLMADSNCHASSGVRLSKHDGLIELFNEAREISPAGRKDGLPNVTSPTLMEKIFGLDLPTLWFLVVGAVFTGYSVLDGFDLGAGAVHRFFKKEESRRIALNAIGPVWDGNEVWLVIGGGTLFAGFAVVYATVLSAFYVPFMLFLVALIFRAISMEFRGKEPIAWWRRTWDWGYSLSSILFRCCWASFWAI